MGDGGEKSRNDLRDGVRCAWAKPSLDAITTSNARMASGSPETFPAPCAMFRLFNDEIRVSCVSVRYHGDRGTRKCRNMNETETH